MEIKNLKAENYYLRTQVNLLKHKITQLFIFCIILTMIGFFSILFDIQDSNLLTREIIQINKNIERIEIDKKKNQ